MLTRRTRRSARWALGLGLAAMAAALVLVAVLRRDQAHVFLAARDRVVGVQATEVWSTEHSRVERLRLLDARGSGVGTVLVRVPVAPTGARRSLVVYAGKQTGDRILDLIPERPDIVLVAPLYPNVDPRGWLEAAAWPAAVRAAVFATVAGGMAALAHLDEAGIERGRTVVLAASLGSSFGTIHAALDTRVDELVVVHGGGDLPLVVGNLYRDRGKPLLAAVLPWVAAAFVDTFDPVHWIGAVAPRPVLLIATRRDKYFPVASIEALHAAAASPKQLVWTDTDHVGASKTEIVATIVAEIEAYLERTANAPAAAGS